MPAAAYPTAETAEAAAVATTQPFSLCLGGPLFQFLRRTRLCDETLGLLHRRIAVAVAAGWLPLAILSALQGRLLDGRLPFLSDIGFHVRFLVVIPLLIGAEVLVHRRLRPILEQFFSRDLVRHEQIATFADAVDEAMRWRNSKLVELLLIGLVYAAGVGFALDRYTLLGGDAWYASSGGRISPAGLWLVFVSLPILQFLLLRWYFRLFVWGRLLWRVSKLDLDLTVTHPDRSGGLGFLSDSIIAFLPLSAAHGLLFSGMIADRIFFTSARLTDFQMEILGAAAILVALFAGPLVVFWPQLAFVKRQGLHQFGALSQTYVREFRAKWLSGRLAMEPLLGSGDIQSLADLGNSFGAAEQMRFAPVRPAALLAVVGAFLAPILPLTLTMMSPEALLGRLVGLVF